MQSFAKTAFSTLLAEGRKYRCSLTLANQMLEQLDDATTAAIFGNCSSLIAFQVGARDAEALAAQLGGVTPQDRIQLPKYTAYAKLYLDGPTPVFSLTTLPPPTKLNEGRSNIIRRTSRRRYGRAARPVRREAAHASTA